METSVGTGRRATGVTDTVYGMSRSFDAASGLPLGPEARRALDAICISDATRDYVLLGRNAPSGSVWRWIEGSPG